MTRLMPLVALLALGGCASLPKTQSRLASKYVGQPPSVISAKYGEPFVYGNQRNHYQWRVYKTDFLTMFATSTSQVSGTVNGRPYDGTVTSPSPYGLVTEECIFNVVLDENHLIQEVSLYGSPAACRKVS